MKKVKCNTGGLMDLTNGKVYEVISKNEESDRYFFINDKGVVDFAHKSHFTEVNDIEVGSDWINKQDGRKVKVDYASEHIVVYGNGEYHATPRLFKIWNKPKPKTVTMYFYKHNTGNIFASEKAPAFTEVLFTREIELP